MSPLTILVNAEVQLEKNEYYLLDASLNNKIKNKYKKYLANHPLKCKYFRIVNMGKDKKPVLLIANKVSNGNNASQCSVYTFHSGKVVYKGNTSKSEIKNEPLRYANENIYCHMVNYLYVYKIEGNKMVRTVSRNESYQNYKIIKFNKNNKSNRNRI